MNNKNIIAVLIFLALFLFLGWLFSDVLIYMFIALILSILGNPLVKLLTKIRIKKWVFPQTLAAVVTLLVIIGVICSFFYLIVPLVAKEILFITSIDTTIITSGVADWLLAIENFLREYNLLVSDKHLSELINEQIFSYLQQIDISYFFGDAVGIVSSLFIASFSILFMTFFSLKDNQIFFKMIKKLIPITFRDSFDNILSATRKQLTRYFSGVFIEMIIMGILEGLICYFLGVPNAFLIGFIGGLLNVIPYVGPLIATGLGVIISITALMPTSPESITISYTVLKVLGAFIVSKLLDDFIFQPVIYGKSVQAHPLEIFIIILVAGYVGGIVGMIFAVPAYSLIRIIVKEFFGQYYFQSDLSRNKQQPDDC